MREPSASFSLAAFAAAAALAGFSPQIFHDADTWWHLASGRWILDHHAIPTHDVFSYTFAGTPWNAHEWLSEVLMAGAFGAAGWTGLHILFALAFGVAAATVAGALRRQMDFVPALLTSIIGLACVAGSLLARPHLLALPLLAIWTTALVKARSRETAPPLWLALVMLVWANLHGSFAFGLALAAALGAEAIIAAPERGRTAKAWGIFVGVSILAALANPQGLEGLLFPIRLLSMPGLATIGEWRPSDLSHPSPLLLALLVMTLVLLTGKVRLPIWRAVLIMALTYLALSHARHAMLFGIVAPLLAAPALGATGPAKTQDIPRWLQPALATLCLLLLLVRLALPAARTDDPVTPMAALAHVPPELRARPVLNTYDYGGYLIDQGVRVFIDGRTDMYSTDFLKNDDRLVAGDAASLAATLARYHIAWTIYPSGSRTAASLDRSLGWHRFYADAHAVIHVRDQPPPPG
ncbi:MAG: hypothetical protein V4559_15530 [Pseudomonadota bacterium]